MLAARRLAMRSIRSSKDAEDAEESRRALAEIIRLSVTAQSNSVNPLLEEEEK